MSVDEIRSLVPSFLEVEEGFLAARHLAGDAAWGAFFEGRIAHVAWVFTGQMDAQRRGVRLVRLNRDEAEITHCFTLPEFRGKGIYPFLIRSLFSRVGSAGVRRVFMITTVDNAASQHGIRAAGLSEDELGIWRFRGLGLDLVFRPFRRGPRARRAAKVIERILWP
jgi:GNAT superfamily N-acetyltransferase